MYSELNRKTNTCRR